MVLLLSRFTHIDKGTTNSIIDVTMVTIEPVMVTLIILSPPSDEIRKGLQDFPEATLYTPCPRDLLHQALTDPFGHF